MNDANPANNAQKRLEKVSGWLFILTILIFILLSINLAISNINPGSPDSKSNLDVARNILHGEGFTSHIVIQYFVKQAVPNPEVLRNPGVPYLLAGCFKLFGFNLSIQVIINAITILLSALMLRYVVMLFHRSWLANLAGIFMLISPNYEIVSILNNNFLILCTVAFVYVATLNLKRNLNSLVTALMLGLISAIGFNMKYTFILSALPAGIVLFLWVDKSKYRSKNAVGTILMFLIVTAIFSSPILIRNYNLFGKLMYTPLPALRLAERYAGMEHSAWRWVHFQGPVTIRELVSIYGTSWLIKKEIMVWIKVFLKVLLLNLPLAVLAVASIRRWGNRIDLKIPVIALLMILEPLFSALYWRQETRYLWPIFPCLILLAILPVGFVKSRVMNSFAAVLITLGLVYGLIGATTLWKDAFKISETGMPGWTKLAQAIPDGSVIITNDPWTVAWYTEKCAVIYPVGDKNDLMQMIDIYHPKYYLNTGEGFQGDMPPLEYGYRIDKGGDEEPKWVFYEIE